MYRTIVVTNRHLCAISLVEQVEKLCQQGVDGIMLREKDMTEAEYERLAVQVMKVCAKYEVPCVLHYFVAIALRLKARAIHVPLVVLREERSNLCGNFDTIGVSVHSVEEAKEACELGATYVTAGNIYATDCKKGLPGRGLEFLHEVSHAVQVPVYGIGGMEKCTAGELARTGAAGKCLMSSAMNTNTLEYY